MNAIRTFAIASTLLALAACTAGTRMDYGSKQMVGTLVGAGAGGLLGAQIGKGSGKLAATAAGTLIGGLLGNAAGRSLDRADAAYARRAEGAALEYTPSGSSLPWRNPDSGTYGTVQPSSVYQAPSGEYCREFRHTIVVGGKREQAFGRACRQPDGTWEIIG